MKLSEIDVKGKKIILDIDGTLVASGEMKFGETVLDTVRHLQKLDNKIFLLSNKGLSKRDKSFALAFGAEVIETQYRKPDPRCLHDFKSAYGDLVIVGDKLLTDGFLAFLIGVPFFKVNRVVSGRESTKDKIYHMVDDLVRIFVASLRLLRLRQWIKNLIVFAPLFFGLKLFTSDSLFPTVVAFFSFCLIASAGYIINDVFDKDQDRKHEQKRLRPIASGEINLNLALLIASILTLVSLWAVSVFVPSTLFLIVIYLFSSMLYSMIFKTYAGIEFLFFMWFYLARLFAGSLSANVTLTPWIISAFSFLILFVIVAKRYEQVSHGILRHQNNQYSQAFLKGLLYVSAGLAISFYTAYTFIGTSFRFMIFTIIPVSIAIIHYLRLTIRLRGVEYPEKIILKDKYILLQVITWTVMVFINFYILI